MRSIQGEFVMRTLTFIERIAVGVPMDIQDLEQIVCFESFYSNKVCLGLLGFEKHLGKISIHFQ